MRRLLSVAAMMLVVLTACRKNENGQKICFTRTATTLKITNNTQKAYSYIAMGQNIQPLIDWYPICNYDIKASATTTKNLSEFPGYQNSDTLVVYWWDCINDTHANLQFVKLAKNQTSCATVRPL